MDVWREYFEEPRIEYWWAAIRPLPWYRRPWSAFLDWLTS